MSLFSYQSAVCFSVILFCSLATAFILYHIFLYLSSAFFNFFWNRFFRTCILCRTAWKGFVWSLKSFRIVLIVCLIHSILLATNDILHYFSGSVNTFFNFFEDTGNRALAEGGMQSIWHASHPAPPASASIAVIRGQLASLAHAALWQHGRHRAPCGCPAMLRVDLLSASCQLFFANSKTPAKTIVWGDGSCVAKRWELQLRVFCIYKRPAALRSKKFAAILQHFPLGMMCGGRRVFQSGVFCIYKRLVL